MNNATLITGASRGIGHALALRFSEETPVILVARDEAKLKTVCEEIRSKKGVAECVVGDVTDPQTLSNIQNLCSTKQLAVKNLLLNAGVSKTSGLTEENSWDEIFKTNFSSPVAFIKAFLPGMLSQKEGNICLLAGTAGIKGFRNMSAYCASKHALVGLARSLALEVGNKGITAIPVCPGPVDTDMTDVFVRGLTSRGMTAEAAKTKIAEINGQKRLLLPKEVAEVVANVCNKKISFTNGEPLLVQLPES